MIKADEFIQHFLNPEQEKLLRYAAVDPNYTSGRPKLIFERETVVTSSTFPHLASYTPVANDKVAVLGNLVIGKVV